MDGDGSLVVLVFGPAGIGVAALVGIVLLALRVRRREPGPNRAIYYFMMLLLAVVALGIGTCYGVLLLN